MSEKETRSFKENMKRLEEVSERLDNEELDLEDAIALYEEGVALSKLCMTSLNEAELKITTLKNSIYEEMKTQENGSEKE